MTDFKLQAVVCGAFGAVMILSSILSLAAPFFDPSPYHQQEFYDAFLLIICLTTGGVFIGLGLLYLARILWKKKPE